MPKSTAALASLLTLIVGYLLGSAIGLSALQGSFDRSPRDPVADAFVSCDEKFQALKDQLTAACGEGAERTEGKVNTACTEAVTALRTNFSDLTEFCANLSAPVDSKMEIE